MARKRRGRGNSRNRTSKSERSSKARPGRPGQVRATRRDTSRLPTTTSRAVRSRRSVRRVLTSSEPSVGLTLARKDRDKMPSRRRNRRAGMSTRRLTDEGLPAGILSLRRSNENASANQTRRSLCTRKKAARRHMIIATGYGGRNGVKNYRRQDKCR